MYVSDRVAGSFAQRGAAQPCGLPRVRLARVYVRDDEPWECPYACLPECPAAGTGEEKRAIRLSMKVVRNNGGSVTGGALRWAIGRKGARPLGWSGANVPHWSEASSSACARHPVLGVGQLYLIAAPIFGAVQGAVGDVHQAECVLGVFAQAGDTLADRR